MADTKTNSTRIPLLMEAANLLVRSARSDAQNCLVYLECAKRCITECYTQDIDRLKNKGLAAEYVEALVSQLAALVKDTDTELAKLCSK